jgi:CSLREA domain-containing protein
MATTIHPSKRLLAAIVMLLPISLALVSAASTVHAGTSFTVTTTIDESNPAGCAGGGRCSLRSAIQEANLVGGANTINVPAGTYILNVGGGNFTPPTAPFSGHDLQVDSSITLVGAGAGGTLIQGNNDRVFNFQRFLGTEPNIIASISGVTITGGTSTNGSGVFVGLGVTLNMTDASIIGNSASGDPNQCGGCGGGIYNFGDDAGSGGRVTLTDCVVSGNTATFAGGGIVNAFPASMVISGSSVSNNTVTGPFGGAVRNTGSLTIVGSRFDGNRAGTGAPAIAPIGGAIHSGGAAHLALLSVTDSTFTNNTVPVTQVASGGAIANDTGGLASLLRATISGNSAYEGGGIINDQGTITLTQSTIAGNTAFFAGGLYNETFAPQASQTTFLTLLQSTVSGNTASASCSAAPAPPPGVLCGQGGGILSENSTTNIENSTISGNVAGTDGGGVYNLRDARGTTANALLNIISGTVANNRAGRSGGGILNGGTTVFKDALVGGNVAVRSADCLHATGSASTSNGNNLDSDNTCLFTVATDRHGNPLLGPLGSNGGPTLTQALQSGSPAIDAGDTAACAAAPVGGVDQRGVARPQGAACDIGAFEFVLAGPIPGSAPVSRGGPNAQGTPDAAPTLARPSLVPVQAGPNPMPAPRR